MYTVHCSLCGLVTRIYNIKYTKYTVNRKINCNENPLLTHCVIDFSRTRIYTATITTGLQFTSKKISILIDVRLITVNLAKGQQYGINVHIMYNLTICNFVVAFNDIFIGLGMRTCKDVK